MAENTFKLWVSGCCHVPRDKSQDGRESLAEPIRQSEDDLESGGRGFPWDIAIHLGDFSATQTSPADEEGAEIVRQFGALKKHEREQFYCIAGNHDASPHNEPCQWWFRKWIDPVGENTEYSGVDSAKRPYPVEGTWERYSFRVGNILFLMMSDRNNDPPPVGRGKYGGYPAGAVSGETFEWWKQAVQSNQDSIVISAHHHVLRETTVGSGPWEGFKKDENGKWRSHRHGYFEDGGPEGAAYLYFVDGKPDAGAFESFLAESPGAIDIWLGAHTHVPPDVVINGRSHIEKKWGVNFINAAALTKYHCIEPMIPMSRLLTFTEGSDQVKVQCYIHTSDLRDIGWYQQMERTVSIGKPFQIGR